MKVRAAEAATGKTVPSDFRDIQRYGEPELFEKLGIFLGPEIEGDQFGIPFILSRPAEETDHAATHDRRVAAVRGWLLSSGYLITDSFDQEFGDTVTLGLHNDHRPGRWGFNVHTTLEGGGNVFMARYTGPEGKRYTRVASALWMTEAVPRTLADGWPGRVDPAFADPVVWQAHLSVGESVIFPVWNETPPEPIGMWHEFMSDAGGRHAVVNNFEFQKQ